jgi:uncharacterized protein DUF2637
MTARLSPRTTAIGVTSLIGAATAAVSYTHALDVVRMVGSHGNIGYLIPLFADGLIFLCSTAIYASTQDTGHASRWAWTGLVIGCFVTIAMNVIAGVVPNLAHVGAAIGGALVGALTPTVLLIALPVLEHMLRTAPAPKPGDKPRSCPHGLPGSVADAAVADYLHRRDCLGEQPTYGAVADTWRVDRRKLPQLVAAVSAPAAGPEPEPSGAALNGGASAGA